METKIYIDPRCDRRYCAFYIKGLYDTYGRKNVRYSLRYSRSIDMSKRAPSDNPMGGEETRLLLFVIKQDECIRKIAIDPWDETYVYDAAYQWADMYAKVNYDKDKTPGKYKERILSIPPSFSIKYQGYISTAFEVLNGIRLCFFPKRLIYKTVSRFARECFMFSRVSLKEYISHDVGIEPKYVFFVSTYWHLSDVLWGEDHTHEGYDHFVNMANQNRLSYINVASTIDGIEFEGGLWSSHDEIYNSKGDKISYSHFISTKEYITKTKQSICVFNTPAVWGCHSWKLAEYMAMSKAIISMPLKNELPEPLVDGENVVFVNNEDEMRAAIIKIANDDAFREKLERGAFEYYKKYMAPTSVINYVLDHGVQK